MKRKIQPLQQPAFPQATSKLMPWLLVLWVYLLPVISKSQNLTKPARLDDEKETQK